MEYLGVLRSSQDSLGLLRTPQTSLGLCSFLYKSLGVFRRVKGVLRSPYESPGVIRGIKEPQAADLHIALNSPLYLNFTQNHMSSLGVLRSVAGVLRSVEGVLRSAAGVLRSSQESSREHKSLQECFGFVRSALESFRMCG